MKTTWEYSLDTEARRILNTASHIAVGFFRVNNFSIIPYHTSGKLPYQSVVFPDLPYNRIPRFWEKVKNIRDKDLPIIADPKLIETISQLLADNNLGKPNYENLKNVWEKAQNEISEAIWRIMPDKEKLLKEVVIFPTLFGTGGSFNDKPTSDGKIYIYLREGRGIYTITECILTSLTRMDIYKDLNGEWSESEILVDWLVTKSSISKVLKKYEPNTNFQPTIKYTRNKQSAKLLKISEDFYKKLGLDVSDKPFSLVGNDPKLNNKPLKRLTDRERILLTLLIENSGNVLTLDEISNILFKSDEDYSLYAISKLIQRLRDKLEENGVSGSYIQTLRGQGYLLKN